MLHEINFKQYDIYHISTRYVKLINLELNLY